MEGATVRDLSSPRTVLDYVDFITHHSAQVQQEVLFSILRENAHCQYLLRHGLDGRTDLESFRSCLPLADYDYMKPDLYRIANAKDSGDKPILCAGRIVELFTSSGTSGGETKFFPTVESDGARKMVFNAITSVVTTLTYPNLTKAGKGLYFYSVRPGEMTRSGLIAQPATSSLLKGIFSGSGPLAPYAKLISSPGVVILTPEKDNQMLHCHLLCGLVQFNEIVRMGSLFAPMLLRALKYLENSWQLLCWDIRHGKLSDRVEEPQVRRAVEELLGGPNPQLADRIESICSHRSSWNGIIGELWPNLLLVEAVTTGSMSSYVPLLRSYVGQLPILSMVYAASEGFLGINLRPASPPDDVAYTLLPFMMYFEFLPVQDPNLQSVEDLESVPSQRHLQVVDMANVKLGQVYELVVTTFAGLYRYLVGDCLKVVRFYNDIPEFRFVERKGLVLSIDTDKTTENELLHAVRAGSGILEQHLNLKMLDYSSYAHVSSRPGHYVVFMELSSDQKLESWIPVLKTCCEEMENALGVIYRRNRNEGLIGPLELGIVKMGSFNLMADAAVARGGSYGQYKTPRCLKRPSDLQLFRSSIVCQASSQRLPTYTPSGN